MSKMSRSLLSIVAMSSLLGMQTNCEIARERKYPYKPKPPKKVGYEHKTRSEFELEERRKRKHDFKAKRKRKGCRKGGKI